VDLAELLTHRPAPAAGLLVTLTQRCPLRCAHCSSASTMVGAAPDPEQLLRFVGTFQPVDRPEFLVLTGGEPLLVPDLVAELAVRVRRAGTRTALLTGGFFAGARRVPAPVLRAIRSLDHLSVSIDAFHEREVTRSDAFRLLRTVLGAGVAASIHTVGSGPDDPYLADLIADARRAFQDRVPILVNTIRPFGRAAGWATGRRADPDPSPDPDRVLPCAMAAWPVVTADGAVVACCNQDVVDRRPVPSHLWLGHVATDDWAAVRARALASPVLRTIRTIGPVQLLARARPSTRRPDGAGYCQTCRALSEDRAAIETARRLASGVVGEMLDRHAAHRQVQAGPVAFVRRHGSAPHAELVALTPTIGS
jgi:pyruvate-formate lyase-activating enzyme